MEEKYLPIGTVCTIKGNGNKLMIVGYLSVEYNGNITVSDYKACIYPNGIFSNNTLISFNQSDIEKVDYIGFKSSDYYVFNDNIKSASIKENIKKIDVQEKSNQRYVFDENGVIIFDNSAKVNNSNSSDNINNDVNPFVKENKEEIEEVKNVNSGKFVFDENGVIVGYNEDDNTTQVQDEKSSTSGGYVFDENGYIIAYNSSEDNNKSETKEVKNDSVSEYEFDENGVIIAHNGKKENAKKEEKVESKYKFDENGVIVA